MPLAGAQATDAGLPDHIATFVEARTADAVGDQARAARLFAALSHRDPANGELARRAVSTAIEAGDSDLALSVARTMAPAALGLERGGRVLDRAEGRGVTEVLRGGSRGERDRGVGLERAGAGDGREGALCELAHRTAGADGAQVVGHV